MKAACGDETAERAEDVSRTQSAAKLTLFVCSGRAETEVMEAPG